jgi:hypothetical protein
MQIAILCLALSAFAKKCKKPAPKKPTPIPVPKPATVDEETQTDFVDMVAIPVPRKADDYSPKTQIDSKHEHVGDTKITADIVLNTKIPSVNLNNFPLFDAKYLIF